MIILVLYSSQNCQLYISDMQAQAKYLLIKMLSVVVLLLPLAGKISAQIDNDTLCVLDAVVITSDSLLPIKNAHIVSKYTKWGAISNTEGRFKLYVTAKDSLLVTTMGFAPKIIRTTPEMFIKDSVFEVQLTKDTLTINEVVIRGYYDYVTMKQIVVEMKPVDLTQFYPDWDGTGLLYKDPGPMSFKGPIQALYDAFNRSARLQRKLIKNRADYNRIMNQMGRYQDTIPVIPEHMLR